MSSRLPHLTQATLTSSMPYVARQSGLMHCWCAASAVIQCEKLDRRTAKVKVTPTRIARCQTMCDDTVHVWGRLAVHYMLSRKRAWAPLPYTLLASVALIVTLGLILVWPVRQPADVREICERVLSAARNGNVPELEAALADAKERMQSRERQE